MYKLSSILVVAIAAAFSSTAIANANNNTGYQASIIQNSTNKVLRFEVSWGGRWEHRVIQPGGKIAIWRNLNSGGWKNLGIRFDNDPGPGINMRRYNLRTYRYHTTLFGNVPPTERFRFAPNGTLDLYHNR